MTSFSTGTTSADAASVLKSHIQGKVVLITGASPNGLGAATALAIANHNPGLLILAGRSKSKIEETQSALNAQSPAVKTRLLIVDLASFASVREAAAEINAYAEKIDVLINNAGIMVPQYEKTVDGMESQFAVNHLGPFLFTNLLLDKIVAAGGGRIVNVTSGAYQFGGVNWEDPNPEEENYGRWPAYAQSKTANILYSGALAERLGSKGIYSYSVAPGAIQTSLTRYFTPEDVALMAQTNIRLIPVSEGTATHVIAAFDPAVEGTNGAYLEICEMKEVITDWAKGKENMDKLWTLSEKLVGQKFDFSVNSV